MSTPQSISVGARIITSLLLLYSLECIASWERPSWAHTSRDSSSVPAVVRDTIPAVSSLDTARAAPPAAPKSFGLPRAVLVSDSTLARASLDSARTQIGVHEAANRNDGPRIRLYLAAVGLSEGNPYCAAFVVWCFRAASDAIAGRPTIPIRRTALASAIYADARKRGRADSSGVHAGDLVVWKFSRTINGHVGRIDSVGRAGWVATIEANTSSGARGSQRDGGGVYRRRRNLRYPLGRMPLYGLVGFEAIAPRITTPCRNRACAAR